jgi:hypothetical protein
VILDSDQRETLHWRSFVKRKLCCPWRRWNIGGRTARVLYPVPMAIQRPRGDRV